MKNPFKRKKNKFPTDSVARPLEEINKAYGEELARAGQTQYLVFVYSKELEQSNQKLLALNQEAKARNDLNAQAPKSNGVAEQGVQNEQA